MTNLTVGPTSSYASITAAMLDAIPGDTITLEAGYSNETAEVTRNNLTIFGQAESLGITLNLALGIPTVTLTGTAPINVLDASDGNGIVGNAGDNQITVSGGVDAVDGGLGTDRLIVDYGLATGAVTGDSTSNFTEAGGGGRSVTITDGTVENFTILTGSGADTITTGSGNDIIRTGDGASTVNAGQGANIIVGGDNADTITALDGGNDIDAGNGENTITSGAGNDTILTGIDADTVVAGGGIDLITLLGGTDNVDAGAGTDRLIIDYSAMTSDVIGGITGGNIGTGYTGHIADAGTNVIDFVGSEQFTITTGSGNDRVLAGGGMDVLRGGGGNDMLEGGDGQDTLNGGDGDDVLLGGATQLDLRDVVFGGNGNDRIDGGYGNDSLNGGFGNDVILGGFGTDTVIGGAGDDVLAGSAGSDLMFGNDGFDFINGGFGNDRLNGGADGDRFFHAGVAGHGSDWIQDFSSAEGDVLLFGGASASADQFQVNFTATNGAGDGAVDEAFVIYKPTGQILWALVDGAGETSINLSLNGGEAFDLLQMA